MNGADWRTMSWVEYQHHLAGWNAAHDPKGARPTGNAGGLKRFMAAHGVAVH